MKKHAPAAERNRDPILDVLLRVLAEAKTVLEVGSGTGQHAVFFARSMPDLSWQPTDNSDAALASIRVWVADAGLNNCAAPIRLDVCEHPWPVERVDAVVSINLIHIAPIEVTEALMVGASRVLAEDGVLFMYGPYNIDGSFTAPSNEAFNGWLQRQDPSWGIRDMGEVNVVAAKHGFRPVEVVQMAANNHSLVFERT